MCVITETNKFFFFASTCTQLEWMVTLKIKLQQRFLSKEKKNRNNCQISLATVLSLLLQLLLTVDWLRFLVKRSGLMPFKQAMLHKIGSVSW